MEHAGFDGLHNPLGVAMVCASLLLFSAMIVFGAGLIKRAMRREKEMRARMRQARAESKKPLG